MSKTFGIAASATALLSLSLYLWRVAYIFSDWAILALIPLAVVTFTGCWTLMLVPWKARLTVILRADSQLSQILTGRLRAFALTIAFTAVSVILLAWQALSATLIEGVILTLSAFASGCIYSYGQNFLARNFHQPFDRVIATSLATWTVGIPLTLFLAGYTYNWDTYSSESMQKGFVRALQIGMTNLPPRSGWIAQILAVPYAFEAAKLWIVFQLDEYPVVGMLFSLDAALFSFVLCRVSIVVTQFVETRIWKHRK